MSKITLRASGTQAPDDMPPGEWIARCEHGEIKQRGNKVSAVLSFSVLGRFTDEGFVNENEGVLFKQWYFLAEIKPNQDDIVLEIQPYSKYGTAWALAMGRPLKSGEDPNPEAFQKKIFRVDVGFSSAAGGSFSYRNLGRKKDARDFLRIHTILEKIEEITLTHMSHMTHKHVHVQEHEHEHDTRALTQTSTMEGSSKVISLRMNQGSKMNHEQRPQGHATGAALAPSTAAAPAPEECETTQMMKGIKAEDVVRLFGRGKLVSHNGKSVSCSHCSGPIVALIEANGRQTWSCHHCGRRAKTFD